MSTSSCCSASASQQLFKLGLESQQLRVNQQDQQIENKRIETESSADISPKKTDLAEPLKGQNLDLYA